MCCGGGGGGDAEERKRNKEIDKQLRADEERMQNEVKLLLLGAGDSGKSTILKQMKLIHDNGFTKEDRETYREVIIGNTISSMQSILEAMPRLGIEFADEGSQAHADTLAALGTVTECESFPAGAAAAIAALWKDAGVLAAVERSNEFQLNDSARYLFDNLERISAANYIPDEQDLLRSRVKTTGITETTFKVGELTYRMFDVGGQRSERKKWIHCFENVTAVIFVVALSAYDQMLVEDESVNRLQEALTLFDSICNSKWFIKTSIILFLNKIDIFREKIVKSPLEKYFPDYSGGPNFDAAAAFLTSKFVALNQSDAKQIYVHQTCATDTKQIAFVMAAVNDIIIQNNLRECGLL